MAWTVLVARAAQKQLTRFPVNDQREIGSALRSLATDPFTGDILKLEGPNNRWRRRVGNYRIFFTVDTAARTVAVSAIARRTATTY